MTRRRLFDYYKSMEVMVSLHGWSADYLDNCEPFAKDLYSGLIMNRKREQQAVLQG
jgi:hypothetical protein